MSDVTIFKWIEYYFFLLNQNDYIHTDQEQLCTEYTAILHLGPGCQSISKAIAEPVQAQPGRAQPTLPSSSLLAEGWGQIQTIKEQVPVT